MEVDERARGTVPRFIDLPLPDETLYEIANIIFLQTRDYYKEKEWGVNSLKDAECYANKEFVDFCYETSQKIVEKYEELKGDK